MPTYPLAREATEAIGHAATLIAEALLQVPEDQRPIMGMAYADLLRTEVNSELWEQEQVDEGDGIDEEDAIRYGKSATCSNCRKKVTSYTIEQDALITFTLEYMGDEKGFWTTHDPGGSYLDNSEMYAQPCGCEVEMSSPKGEAVQSELLRLGAFSLDPKF